MSRAAETLRRNPGLANCSGCGICLRHCPVYALSGKETESPRGRLRLAIELARRHIPAEALQNAFSTCLQCGRCEKGCPARLPLMEFFAAVRKDMAKFLKPRQAALALEAIMLTRPGTAEFLHPVLAAAQRLPGVGIRLPETLPRLPRMPFMPDASKDEETSLPKALLFPGCITTHFYPGLAEDCAALLRNAGIAVITPRKPGCCGRPLLMRGASLLPGVARFLDIIENIDFKWLTTPCPGCLDTIRRVWPNLEGLTDEQRQKARALSKRAVDICAFIKAPDAPVPANVIWHKPCLQEDDLAGKMEMFLNSRSGSGASCCGAPLFCMKGRKNGSDSTDSKGGLAGRLARNIRQRALSAGAARIVTACPGCMLALQSLPSGLQGSLPAGHIVSLFAGRQ